MTSETKPSSAVTLGRHSVVALAVFWCVWVLGSGKGTVAMEGSCYAAFSDCFPLGIFGPSCY